MLKLRTPALRKAGLSGAKVLAMKDVAKKTIEGIVPSIEAAEKMSDEELVKRLVSVRGVGAWTVEMFLIFRLGRPDVLPIHDLGVQKGWSVAYGKKHKPSPKELLVFGNAGAPIAPSPAGTCGAPSNAPATPHQQNPPKKTQTQARRPAKRPKGKSAGKKSWPLKLLNFRSYSNQKKIQFPGLRRSSLCLPAPPCAPHLAVCHSKYHSSRRSIS